jgi:hypothetical protein
MLKTAVQEAIPNASDSTAMVANATSFRNKRWHSARPEAIVTDRRETPVASKVVHPRRSASPDNIPETTFARLAEMSGELLIPVL